MLKVKGPMCAGMLNGDFNVSGGTGSCECNGETG